MLNLIEAARNRVEQCLLRLWYPPTGRAGHRLLAATLQPLAWLTARVAGRRRSALIAAARRPARPLLVVGNLIAGGTGKTPAVIAIALELTRRGLKVGLLAGGYRARRGGSHLVDADGDADLQGDEPVLLARRTGLPVAAGRDRQAALSVLLDRHPQLDLVISDDGLQHAGLPRTVELAVFDGRGAGNGRLLPAGPLREPLEHALAMDGLLLNGAAPAPIAHPHTFRFDVVPDGFRRVREADAAATVGAVARQPIESGPMIEPAAFARQVGGQTVLALAGMAEPRRFIDTLTACGLSVEPMRLADHARIDPARLARWPGRWIVMTDKDAVKLRHAADDRCWTLSVSARFEPAFFDWLMERLLGQSTA